MHIYNTQFEWVRRVHFFSDFDLTSFGRRHGIHESRHEPAPPYSGPDALDGEGRLALNIPLAYRRIFIFLSNRVAEIMRV